MGLTKAEREQRRTEVLAELRKLWTPGARRDVELRVQRGRRRERLRGRLAYVPPSGAYVLLGVDDPPDVTIGERGQSLHVPLDIIRNVRRA